MGDISTGRGGAGNIRSSQVADNSTVSDLPQLQGDVFTTGRGGKGNMMKNIDPDTTRAAQDGGEGDSFERVELEPTRSVTVGRGGYGNHMHMPQSQSENDTRSAKKSGCCCIC